MKIDPKDLEIARLETKIRGLKSKLSYKASKDVAEITKTIDFEGDTPVTIHLIQKCVCAYFSIPLTLLIGKRRYPKLVTARHLAMYLARDENFSYPEIGTAFNKDHTTAIHGVGRFKERLLVNSGLVEAVKDIRKVYQSES